MTGRIISDADRAPIPGACVSLINAANHDPQMGCVNSGCANQAGRFTVLVPTSGSSASLDLRVAAGSPLAITVVNADRTPVGRNLDGFITLTTGEYIGGFDYYNGTSYGSNATPGRQLHPASE